MMMFENEETQKLETALQSPLDAGPYKDIILKNIPSNEAAIFIPVLPQDNCAISDCFENCQKLATSQGGAVLYGWAIRVWPRRYIYAEAHAIWLISETEALDPTPRGNDEDEILFLIDRNVEKILATQDRIASHIIPLTDNPNVLESVRLRRQFEEIQAKHGKYVPAATMMNEIMPAWTAYSDHLKNVEFDIAKEDPCTCFSRLQASECCYQHLA